MNDLSFKPLFNINFKELESRICAKEKVLCNLSSIYESELYELNKPRRCVRCHCRFTRSSNYGSWTCSVHPLELRNGKYLCCQYNIQNNGQKDLYRRYISKGCTKSDHVDADVTKFNTYSMIPILLFYISPIYKSCINNSIMGLYYISEAIVEPYHINNSDKNPLRIKLQDIKQDHINEIPTNNKEEDFYDNYLDLFNIYIKIQRYNNTQQYKSA